MEFRTATRRGLLLAVTVGVLFGCSDSTEPNASADESQASATDRGNPEHSIRLQPVLASWSAAAGAPDESVLEASAFESCEPEVDIDELPAVPTPIGSDVAADCVVLESPDGGELLLLDAAAIAEADFTDATAVWTGASWGVELEMTPAGVETLNAMAAAQYPLLTPRNQVAIVVDSVVQSAPMFQSRRLPGSIIFVSGLLTEAAAARLAADINLAIDS